MTLFLAFFFGIFFPIKHIFSSQQELPELFEKIMDNKTFEFYVRRPDKLTPRRPCYISTITELPVCINYRKCKGRKSQKCIIQVEPLDIAEVGNVDDNPQNFANCVTSITVHAEVHEVHELPTITE